MQLGLAVDLAEQHLFVGELGQQAVADHSADPDRPQPRGEAEEEYRSRDPALSGADAPLHPVNDAVEQFGVGVKLLYRAPAAINRPGPDGEIPVDV
jgi:hypothetical protein